MTFIDKDLIFSLPNLPVMFEYTKQILTKVSFDRILFKKELIKALRVLQKDERRLLKVWCLGTFAAYSGIVVEVFRKFS